MYELVIAGLFLVFFSISDNYVGDVIGCKTRKLFMNNMIFKHISLIFFIFFAVNLSSEEHMHPLIAIRNTFVLWIFYILFIRMDTTYLGICFFLLISYYLLETYKSYLKNHDINTYNQQIDELEKYSQYIMYIFIVPLIIGFYKYYKEERKLYGSSFNYLRFILGHKKCK